MKWRKVQELEETCINFEKVQGQALQFFGDRLDRLREDYIGFDNVQRPYIPFNKVNYFSLGSLGFVFEY